MESNDEVQEIDPSVITQFRRKKYQWRVLKEELNVRFCCLAKDIITMWKTAKTKMVLILRTSQEKH
jgi:hypothetical protein